MIKPYRRSKNRFAQKRRLFETRREEKWEGGLRFCQVLLPTRLLYAENDAIGQGEQFI
jgi:hypothetical protein